VLDELGLRAPVGIRVAIHDGEREKNRVETSSVKTKTEETKQEVDKMFVTKYRPELAFGSLFDSFDREFAPLLRSRSSKENGEPFRVPLTNINETDESYVVTMEMPGVLKKDVDVSIEGDELVVTASRSEKLESEGLLRREIREERFRRSFSLGRSLDRENIKAKLENGVLKITLAKKAESVGRKVDVD
jgi:HSP20 family protein